MFVQSILTKPQWRLMETCLQHPNITPPMRKQLNTILFHHYVPLAYKKTTEFIKFHRFKTKQLQKDDLYAQSLIGLHHAVQNYHGFSNFYKYASIYINGALYNGLSIHSPISKIRSKRKRMKQSYNKTAISFDEVYNTNVNTYLGTQSELPYRFQIKSSIKSSPSYYQDYETYIFVWDYVETLPAFTKRILYSKFNFYLDIIRSNWEVAQLCGCSEETVRKNVRKTVMYLTVHNIYPRNPIINL